MAGGMRCLIEAVRMARGQRAGQEPAVNVVLLVLALKMLNRKELEVGITDQSLGSQQQDQIYLRQALHQLANSGAFVKGEARVWSFSFLFHPQSAWVEAASAG